MNERAKILDMSQPHPLAPPGSPTLAEEHAAHARQLEEQSAVRDLERRQDRLLLSIDSVFELINDQVLPAITRMEASSAESRVEQTSMVTAMNRMADRIDKMGKTVADIDVRVIGLERVSGQFDVLGARVTAIEQEVAELRPRLKIVVRKAKAPRSKAKLRKKSARATRKGKA